MSKPASKKQGGGARKATGARGAKGKRQKPGGGIKGGKKIPSIIQMLADDRRGQLSRFCLSAEDRENFRVMNTKEAGKLIPDFINWRREKEMLQRDFFREVKAEERIWGARAGDEDRRMLNAIQYTSRDHGNAAIWWHALRHLYFAKDDAFKSLKDLFEKDMSKFIESKEPFISAYSLELSPILLILIPPFFPILHWHEIPVKTQNAIAKRVNQPHPPLRLLSAFSAELSGMGDWMKRTSFDSFMQSKGGKDFPSRADWLRRFDGKEHRSDKEPSKSRIVIEIDWDRLCSSDIEPLMKGIFSEVKPNALKQKSRSSGTDFKNTLKGLLLLKRLPENYRQLKRGSQKKDAECNATSGIYKPHRGGFSGKAKQALKEAEDALDKMRGLLKSYQLTQTSG